MHSIGELIGWLLGAVAVSLAGAVLLCLSWGPLNFYWAWLVAAVPVILCLIVRYRASRRLP